MLRLRPFLDESSQPLIEEILHETPCVVTPVRARRTKHGDHRQRTGEAFSEVTVNVSGNRYQFLITLLHELAHAVTLQRHGSRAAAHGREWREIFAQLLRRALDENLFPTDLAPACGTSGLARSGSIKFARCRPCNWRCASTIRWTTAPWWRNWADGTLFFPGREIAAKTRSASAHALSLRYAPVGWNIVLAPRHACTRFIGKRRRRLDRNLPVASCARRLEARRSS